ncbi:MAG: hypothetical protein HOV81_30330 [Kofleriaceae bacterium]|nr:hypothetical protein [Kofleriaceae bacterium]
MNVPRNTKLWVLDHTGAPGSAATNLTSGPLPNEPSASLAPNTEYSPDGTRFTTGADVDETPPAMPANVTASIIVMAQPAEYMPVDAVTLWGDYDDDTALIKVDLWDGQRETTFYTTPNRLYLCAPGVSIRPGTIRVTIRAIDLAGNESPPVTTSVEATASAGVSVTTEDCGEGPRQYTGRHFRCGTGDLAVLLLIPIVAIGLLIGLIVVRLLRNAKIRRTPPVDVGLLVAEAVVRTIMRRDLVASALGLIATGVALTFEARGLGFVLGLFPLISLSSWGSCRVALNRLARQDASAERRDSWLIIRDRSEESRIRANERVFRAAVRAVLPAASVERD